MYIIKLQWIDTHPHRVHYSWCLEKDWAQNEEIGEKSHSQYSPEYQHEVECSCKYDAFQSMRYHIIASQ